MYNLIIKNIMKSGINFIFNILKYSLPCEFHYLELIFPKTGKDT